jgi:hypothetical protein
LPVVHVKSQKQRSYREYLNDKLYRLVKCHSLRGARSARLLGSLHSHSAVLVA